MRFRFYQWQELWCTLELISHYNPQLSKHIENVQSGKYVTSYFSPLIQNELINRMGNKVPAEILKNVRSAKYFSIMFNCTPDTAHLDQMSAIIRYVTFKDGKCSVWRKFCRLHYKSPEKWKRVIARNIAVKDLAMAQTWQENTRVFKLIYPKLITSLNLCLVQHAVSTSLVFRSVSHEKFFLEKGVEFFNFFSSSTLRRETLPYTMVLQASSCDSA